MKADNNNRLYSNIAYALMGIAGLGGVGAVTNLVPDRIEVDNAKKIEALQSPERLKENRTEAEWIWITGEGKAWLKDRQIDIEQAVKLLVQKNQQIDIVELSKTDPKKAEALMLKAYQEYEGPHFLKGPEKRGYKGPDEEGHNSFGTTYLKQLHDLENQLMKNPEHLDSLAQFITGSKDKVHSYNHLSEYLKPGSRTSFTKAVALSFPDFNNKSLVDNPQLSLERAGALNGVFNDLNKAKFQMSQTNKQKPSSNSIAALHAPRND